MSHYRVIVPADADRAADFRALVPYLRAGIYLSSSLTRRLGVVAGALVWNTASALNQVLRIGAFVLTRSQGILLLAGGTTVLIYTYRTWRRMVPEPTEVLAAQVGQLNDQHLPDGEGDLDTFPPDHVDPNNPPPVVHRQHTRNPQGLWWVSVVAQMRARFDTRADTPAQRACVRHAIYDLCEKRGIRPSHVARMIDIAVAVVFMPSTSQIQAAQIGGSAETWWRRDHVSRSYIPGWSNLVGLVNALFRRAPERP